METTHMEWILVVAGAVLFFKLVIGALQQDGAHPSSRSRQSARGWDGSMVAGDLHAGVSMGQPIDGTSPYTQDPGGASIEPSACGSSFDCGCVSVGADCGASSAGSDCGCSGGS
jgi:hypothetical protein